MKQFSIGILLISTWKYNKFIDPLVSDIKKYLFSKSKVKIYLHTDSTLPHNVDNILYIEHRPWPMITLNRFDTFYSFRETYNTDYLFYIDIDTRIVDYIDEDILSDFVVVKHYKYNGRGTPETNPRSLAFIDPKDNSVYVAGGFFGGSKERFINVSKELSNNINTDLNNNIIAKWHDESHLNRYYNDKQDSIKILPPEYLYLPSNTKYKFSDPKIIPYSDKDKGFNKFEGKLTND